MTTFHVNPGFEIHVADGITLRITAKYDNGTPVQRVIDQCEHCHRFSMETVVVHSYEEAADLGWITIERPITPEELCPNLFEKADSPWVYRCKLPVGHEGQCDGAAPSSTYRLGWPTMTIRSMYCPACDRVYYFVSSCPVHHTRTGRT